MGVPSIKLNLFSYQNQLHDCMKTGDKALALSIFNELPNFVQLSKFKFVFSLFLSPYGFKIHDLRTGTWTQRFKNIGPLSINHKEAALLGV